MGSTEVTFVEHTVLSDAITNTTEISNDSTNTTITSPTIMNTILTNGESYENKNQKNINNGSLVQNDTMLQSMVVDQGTFIIEDDDEKKTKKHSKKKKKKKKKHKDTNVEISSDNGDENANDDAAHIINDINDTVEIKPTSSKKKKKKKKKEKEDKNSRSDDINNDNDGGYDERMKLT